MLISNSHTAGQTLCPSLSAARPVKDHLDWSNEDVKIKIDFVTESSPRASEWVVARLACHYFSRPL